MKTLSDWLETEIRNRGWKPADLANRAKISRGALSNILNDMRRPGPDVCLAIARALQVPPETVFRKAGLLPPKPETALDEEQLLHIYRQLDKRGQREALAILKTMKDSSS